MATGLMTGTVVSSTATFWLSGKPCEVSCPCHRITRAVIDHCSAESVGIHAVRRATRFEALEPIRQGVRRCYGGFAQGIARGLSARHDHGSQYMSDAFQQELAFLGIASSPAFVRAPEGNGCAERLIRTLKENLLWVRTFDTVEELRQALLAFREIYNISWLIERHGFQTPAAVRQTQLSTRGTGRVASNPVSHKSRAVHSRAAGLKS
jgi:transposase InsO family protein